MSEFQPFDLSGLPDNVKQVIGLFVIKTKQDRSLERSFYKLEREGKKVVLKDKLPDIINYLRNAESDGIKVTEDSNVYKDIVRCLRFEVLKQAPSIRVFGKDVDKVHTVIDLLEKNPATKDIVEIMDMESWRFQFTPKLFSERNSTAGAMVQYQHKGVAINPIMVDLANPKSMGVLFFTLSHEGEHISQNHTHKANNPIQEIDMNIMQQIVHLFSIEAGADARAGLAAWKMRDPNIMGKDASDSAWDAVRTYRPIVADAMEKVLANGGSDKEAMRAGIAGFFSAPSLQTYYLGAQILPAIQEGYDYKKPPKRLKLSDVVSLALSNQHGEYLSKEEVASFLNSEQARYVPSYFLEALEKSHKISYNHAAEKGFKGSFDDFLKSDKCESSVDKFFRPLELAKKLDVERSMEFNDRVAAMYDDKIYDKLPKHSLTTNAGREIIVRCDDADFEKIKTQFELLMENSERFRGLVESTPDENLAKMEIVIPSEEQPRFGLVAVKETRAYIFKADATSLTRAVSAISNYGIEENIPRQIRKDLYVVSSEVESIEKIDIHKLTGLRGDCVDVIAEIEASKAAGVKASRPEIKSTVSR